jgi:hypothetical protein
MSRPNFEPRSSGTEILKLYLTLTCLVVLIAEPLFHYLWELKIRIQAVSFSYMSLVSSLEFSRPTVIVLEKRCKWLYNSNSRSEVFVLIRASGCPSVFVMLQRMRVA